MVENELKTIKNFPDEVTTTDFSEIELKTIKNFPDDVTTIDFSEI